MRLRPLLHALACLVALGCRVAVAQPIGVVSLAWNDCGDAGESTRTFVCNTNSGSEQLYLSFRPPAGVSDAFQLDAVVAVGNVDLSVLPDWWSLLSGVGCRRTALLVSGDFTSSSGACADPWNGLAFGTATVGRVPILSDGLLRRESIHVTMTLPTASPVALDPATEYYGVRLTFTHAKTVGTGACAGCSQPICLALGSATLYRTPAAPVGLMLAQGDRHAVVWNGSESCDRLVAARNRTWGALKSLYR